MISQVIEGLAIPFAGTVLGGGKRLFAKEQLAAKCTARLASLCGKHHDICCDLEPFAASHEGDCTFGQNV